MNNYIKNNVLKLPKQIKNITFHEVIHNGVVATVIKAITKRYSKYHCPHCNSYHKHLSKGYKTINIKYDVNTCGLVILSLKKIRLTCHDCSKTFTPPVDNIYPHKSISNIIVSKIAYSVENTITSKTSAFNNFVSHSFANRVFNATTSSRKYDANFNYLPADIGFDEFKYAAGEMAFIMVDHATDATIDILPSRKTHKLEQYFELYPKHVRDGVKRITMDMYDPYMNIVKKYFVNAVIIIDKFHIIANFTKALSKIRIDVMKQYPVSSINYKRLKKYWKHLLKLDRTDWSYDCYKLSYFPNKMPLRDAVEEIVSIDPQLKLSYNFLTVFHTHLNNKDFEGVEALYEAYKDILPAKMLTPINTFMKYKEYSLNAYRHDISNARVESKIQKIKLVKRIAFGMSNFINFRNRIFYIQEMNLVRKSVNNAVYASKFTVNL